MPRSRNIKPGFFKNELLGTEDPYVSLTFAGLWILADKAGRLEDRPARIKAELFPYRDKLDVNRYLTVLERLKFIIRYSSKDGNRIIQVTKFDRHQHPHHTEKESELPEYIEENKINGEEHVIAPLSNGYTPSDSLNTDSLIPENGRRPRAKRATTLPEDFGISKAVETWASSKRFGRLPEYLEFFKGRMRASGKTYVDWDQAFQNCIREDWPKLRQGYDPQAVIAEVMARIKE